MEPITFDEFIRLPDDGFRHELIDGAHIVSPSPTPLHQRVSRGLFVALMEYFHPRGLGEVFYAPVDVFLSERDVLVPDLVVVAHPSQVTPRGIEGPPLLVVEVVSPSSAGRDRLIKFHRYAALGVAHYWLVDSDLPAVDCYRLGQAGYARVARADASTELLPHPDFPELRLSLRHLHEGGL
jgi:Uma2 family endonuclease